METIAFVSIVIIIILVFDKIKNKNRNKQYKENKEKGKVYEEKVSEYYKNLGYTVIENGKDKGLQDKGIDIIANKEDEILLIQCKNWKIDSKYRIREKEVKEFYGACQFFIDENKINKNLVICVYAVPTQEIINIKAKQIFKKHFQKCKYQII